MAYKAPSGLRSAIRGRSMSQRDYTSGVKFKQMERRADVAVTQTGLGLVQSIASTVEAGASAASSLAQELETNIKSHELAEEGAREIFKTSPEGKAGLEFEESGYKGAEGWRDKWFKSAAELSETSTIGGATFDTAKLMEIGRVSPVARSKMGGQILGEHGEATGEYKSLYEEFKMQEPLDRNITQMESAEVADKKLTPIQKKPTTIETKEEIGDVPESIQKPDYESDVSWQMLSEQEQAEFKKTNPYGNFEDLHKWIKSWDTE